ncbi:MAG: 50S ribosomal protein L22 [Candidatus Micrarchaeota archaeon]|nr:50S ribosomal protein L22 [Candidatus Micrarchaeota archaeon]
MEYAYIEKGKRTARSRISSVNASFKDLCEVCRNVRGKDTEWALEFLGRAAEGKQAIYFARHCKQKGHRRELGGKKGGFPKKSAKFVLGVLENAHANATKLGMGMTKIAHIIANKQDVYPRMSPKGRRIVHNYETAFIEIVLEEAQKKAPKMEKKAPVKQTPAVKQVSSAPAAKATEAKKPEAKQISATQAPAAIAGAAKQ